MIAKICLALALATLAAATSPEEAFQNFMVFFIAYT